MKPEKTQNMPQKVNIRKMVVTGVLTAVAYVLMPFTFIKGLANSLITFAIYKRISPIIK